MGQALNLVQNKEVPLEVEQNFDPIRINARTELRAQYSFTNHRVHRHYSGGEGRNRA